MNRKIHQQHSGDPMEGFWTFNQLNSTQDQSDLASGNRHDSGPIGPQFGAEKDSSDWTHRGPAEYANVLAQYSALKQNSTMSLAYFVETKFVPGHIGNKSAKGRNYYYSMLRHILRPETVAGMPHPEAGVTKGRLKSISGWPYLDDVRLCDLKTEHVQLITSAALDRGYSTETVKHIRTVMGTIILHAKREHFFIGDNPIPQVTLPKMPRRNWQRLTATQARELLAIMEYPEKEIALITALTGMNMMEICGLQWKNVNLTESSIKIAGDIIPARTISVKTQWEQGKLSPVKRNRVRDIEIAPPLLSLLATLRQKAMLTGSEDFLIHSRPGRRFDLPASSCAD